MAAPGSGGRATSARMDTLLDLLDEAVRTYGDRSALGIRNDDGSTVHWSYNELGGAAAWLHGAFAPSLQPGDRILTWSPSTPALPATYFGAMRARLILVPLDLRMSSDAIEGIIRKSGAKHLVIGTGRDAPDPGSADLDQFPTTTVDDLTADPDDSFPDDWEAQLARWPRPGPTRSGSSSSPPARPARRRA